MQRKRQVIELVADGLYKEAITLHSQLHSASFPATRFTFPPLLKACVKVDSPLYGQMLHSQLIKTGFQHHTHSATALANMYIKLKFPYGDAVKVFDEMRHRNLASLNAAISGFASSGHFEKAFLLFREVGGAGLVPNSVTVASVLIGCRSGEVCRQVHCWAIKLGVDGDVYVGTAMVTVYSGCGEIVVARKLFREMPDKNEVSYNALVSGLLDNDMPDLVLNVFKDMRESLSERPNSVTLISVLSACSSLSYLQFGKQVHGFMVKAMVVLDVKLGTALVDMYCKCRSWRWAYDVFNELDASNKNLVTWNSMISGLMLNGQSDIAVELFGLLEPQGLEPDSVTWNSVISGFAQLDMASEAFRFFKKMQSSGTVPSLKSVTSLLRACASLLAMQHGREIHGYAIRTDLHTDVFMATALIDLYMKCGNFSWARRIFDGFAVKPSDPAFWNVMISGYGANGDSESGFMFFYQMLKEKVKPNSGTFTAILSLCSHTGQVDKGLQVFKFLTDEHGLNPKSEHFGCMIDLLGRSGRFDEASKLLEGIQEPSSSVFASLLGACRHHLQPDLGEQVAMKLVELDPDDPTPIVMLSNIYAGVGRWKDAERIRMILNSRKLKKLPGYSLMGVA
ncbi:Pentatricopeptide repeat-containing protein At2g02750 [Linum grandiflorum]